MDKRSKGQLTGVFIGIGIGLLVSTLIALAGSTSEKFPGKTIPAVGDAGTGWATNQRAWMLSVDAELKSASMGTLIVTRSATADTLTVNMTATLDTLVVTNGSTLNATATADTVVVNQTLSVSKTATLDTLTVTNNATVNATATADTLTVNMTATADTLTVTNLSTIPLVSFTPKTAAVGTTGHEGWVAYADSTNWNPGSGRGLYCVSKNGTAVTLVWKRLW